MTDIWARLDGYNTPDRTFDDQRQIAVDIHDAKDEIARLREGSCRFNCRNKREAEEEIERLREVLDQFRQEMAPYRRSPALQGMVSNIQETKDG